MRDGHTPISAMKLLLEPGTNISDSSDVVTTTNRQGNVSFVQNCKASRIQIGDIFTSIL